MRAFLIASAEGRPEAALRSGAAGIIVEDATAASGTPEAWRANRGSPLPWGEGRGEGRGLSGEGTPLTPTLSPWEREPGVALYLRVYSPDDDLAPAMSHRPDGLVLPRCESGRDVARLGARLAVVEAELGLPDGGTRILAMVETAPGMLGLSSLAGSSPRLSGIAWDAFALAAAIGAPAARDSGGLVPPLLQMRGLLRLAAVAAGVEALDTAYPADGDGAGFLEELATARRDGFGAKLAASFDQVAAIVASARVADTGRTGAGPCI